MAFDAHTHLDDPVFDADRHDVMARARKAGVTGIVIAGADPAHWARVRRCAEDLDAVYVLGLHPWWVDDGDPQAVQSALDRLERTPTPHGVGETGLDHHRARTRDARQAQRTACEAQLALAAARGVPVVLHMVRAVDALLDILRTTARPERGMVHAWQAPASYVPAFIEAGMYLSFGPDVLRHRHARDAATRCPLDRLLLETDAPDRPVPGASRGEPAHVVAVAAAIADLRGLDTDAVLAASEANARVLFPTR